MTISPQSTQRSKRLKPLLHNTNWAWVGYLALGLALLPGRFEWSSRTRSANWRGFDCSAFFLCILIPLISGILGRTNVRASARNLIVGGTTLVFSLPYHWLRLDTLYYHRNRPRWVDWKSLPQAPKLVWFPEAFRGPAQIPYEFVFFGLLTLAFVTSGWLYLRARRAAGRTVPRSTAIYGAAVVLLVVIESWMHLSMRSPYTYICHYERPASANYWYQSLLFSNGQGAVNADYFVFRALEEVFIGTPGEINGMLIRRPFPFYISAQFSYFVNPYYVMLFLNITMWVLAVLAIHQYVSAHFGPDIADIAALLTASGPGFIMYVAQPQSYLWGYCAMAIIVWAHWRICGSRDANLADYALFGGIFSLALLTYDLFALLLYLIGYELLFKRSLWKIIVSGGVAIGGYAAFGLLTAHMRSFSHDSVNSNYIHTSLVNALSTLRSNPMGLATYIDYAGLLRNYFWNLSNSVFVFPFLIAAVGLFCLNGSHKVKLIGLLLVPSFATAAFLYFGKTFLGLMPRFSFIAYPAIYVLCAAALWSAGRFAAAHWPGSRSHRAGIAVVLAGVAAQVVLVNADVFGHPWLYYLFYWEQLTPGNF